MEIARNPSDENIKNWIAYNKAKNSLNKRLQKRVREYLNKNSKYTPEVHQVLNEKVKIQKTSFDPSRYRVRMYFDSKCPSCKKMFNTLLKLQNRGVYVEALQIDDGVFKQSQFPIPTQRATKEEIKKHKIESVPFTLVADLKRKALYPPLIGFQNVGSMTTLLERGEKL